MRRTLIVRKGGAGSGRRWWGSLSGGVLREILLIDLRIFSFLKSFHSCKEYGDLHLFVTNGSIKLGYPGLRSNQLPLKKFHIDVFFCG